MCEDQYILINLMFQLFNNEFVGKKEDKNSHANRQRNS